VLTVYPYPDNQWHDVATMANDTAPFGLTGAIFAQDPEARFSLIDLFRDAAGNFYINDKSTGSVVGQQPFGGDRLSGEQLCVVTLFKKINKIEDLLFKKKKKFGMLLKKKKLGIFFF
jgi:acyl-CoA reductase-like NAD-dependent aldehyde dehydrogenase